MHGRLKNGCSFFLAGNLACLGIFCFATALIPVYTAAQNRYDVLITEFLPDPSPSVGLPESSFIEIKNHSTHDYQLRNWKITNGNSSAVIKSDYLLKADSFLILCNSSSAVAFGQFGSALGISGFPSLNNDAGDILLSSGSGNIIHALHYDKSWFNNELKASGGWSLEMIDPSNPCASGKNWTASRSLTGGTPGMRNSADAENPDSESPALIRAVAIDSLNLVFLFDEPVDSLTMTSSDFFISDGIGPPENVVCLPPFFDRASIRLQNPMMTGKIYSVFLQQIQDCSGNTISQHNTCKAGLSQKVKNGDVIFNEILFNPPSFGYDYIELFNRSSKIISCTELFIAGREMNGNFKDPVALVKEDRAFFPGEYLLLTENPGWIIQNYPMADLAQILLLPDLPSMPDDQGKLVLLNAAGEVIDELDYDHHWHSPLLASENGVALEKTNPEPPSNLASSWASAAADAGYGTPGYKNSEYSPDSSRLGADFISVEPKVFSPDLDGYMDFLYIHYHLPAAGFIGSISIYDIYGRMVRNLVNNILWSASGSFRWDGLDDRQNLLPMGHYLIYAELFLPDGTVKKKKMVCALARKP
jgi:hypothetical protein